jgi:DHA2 family multidrug resistance protein-like MFS transporter
MASSLGAAFGVAISAAIFTALSANPQGVHWLEGVITFQGRQDNVAMREAATIALLVNVLMAAAAIIAIMLTVPKAQQKLTPIPANGLERNGPPITRKTGG